MNEINTTDDLLKVIVGLSENEAKNLVKEYGYSIRVEIEDGTLYWGTQDIRNDRINVQVDNNLITKVFGIG